MILKSRTAISIAAINSSQQACNDMSFLSAVVDCSISMPATSKLSRRDGSLLPEEDMVNFKSASLMDTRLSSGKVIPSLKSLRKDSKESP